ncbi:pentapeptide repeat-containing protein [Deinococcus wulumuqiensis]|uniref:pentapeptide repeat-containing protein n=1 Tax=Deinococcus wulumuqiensis TaxID=980427 RepID=UPI0024323576|nr:pentapeptide repeat-containing protein [Deinococcus wulumuqiensis]
MTDPRLAIEQERTEQEQERTERVREHEKSGRFKAFMDAVPLLATLATATVAVFGSLQSQQQYRDAQASERFQSAVELLAGDDLTTRVGGIALLGQVAQTSSERRENAVRLLATYLRVHSPVTEEGRAKPVVTAPPTEEVRAVLSALHYRGDVKGVDLGRISARNLMASGNDLTGLVFARSDLSGSLLEGANLTGVPFRQATLRGVNFRGANLTRAAFQEADLTGAQFQGADLSGADLTQVKGLTSAMLAGATTDADTRLPNGITVPPAEPASTVKPPVR